MALDYDDFVHPGHFPIFVAAAQQYRCHILVRKTGRASLSWLGKPGYTGKRGDLKAKTADLNAGRHPVAGLVCSPFLRPEAFSTDGKENRLQKARAKWMESLRLITVPQDAAGFDDNRQQNLCRTPYLVQTNPNHKHYGCVALVESGLLKPRYVHGDYDLYAILPAGKAFDPATAGNQAKTLRMGTTVTPGSLGLREREYRQMDNREGLLAFQVANHVNMAIARGNSDLLGALMVNHGEAINIERPGDPVDEPLLAIMPAKRDGQWGRILEGASQRAEFYREA